jgi:hypothetical protein
MRERFSVIKPIYLTLPSPKRRGITFGQCAKDVVLAGYSSRTANFNTTGVINRSFPLIFALAMLICGGKGFAYSARVENILARDYFHVVQRELAKASSSVTVCLYSFTLRSQLSDSPVFALAQSLKRARDRGVRVEVILDQNIDFLAGENGGSDLSEGKNFPAYAFLKAQGIPVSFDSPSTYLHSKVVVIDGETVILGSTNWTDSALKRNQETNVLIRSKLLAREIGAALSAIPRQDPLPNNDEAGVEVPGEFLLNPDLFGRMVTRKDDRAFDVYLYLLKDQTNHLPIGSPLLVDHQKLAAALGIDHTGRESYRRQVNRLLAKLQNLYGLIHVQSGYNKASEITFTDLPPGRTAHMPARYWSLGWDRRLSFFEKGFLLISQFESAVSTRRPSWSAAQKTLSRRYGASPWFFSEGSTGLRRKNLLEAELTAFTERPVPRLPTLYTLNTLYDPADLDKKMAELNTKYGAEKFDRARKAAALVFEDCDVDGIKELIDLETRYGRARVAEAVRLLGEKNPDNPHRTMGYLIGTIRNLNIESVP